MTKSAQSGPPAAGAGGIPGNLRDAWEQARQEILGLDPGDTARRTGADPSSVGLVLRYIDKSYIVDLANGEVRHAAAPHNPADTSTATLIAHYLLAADGSPFLGEYASYREFPGGAIYYGPFLGRAVRPLVRRFGPHPGALLRAGTALGGEPVGLGDAAVCLHVLPRLPVTYAVWGGDDEVAASGTVLFDRSATRYLPLEDLVIAASQGTRTLMRAAAEEVST